MADHILPDGWRRYGTGIIRASDNSMIDKRDGKYQPYRYLIGTGRHERIGDWVSTLAEAMAKL